MQRHIIRLDFQSPLHVGTDESLIGIEGVRTTIHSDTVFSGMINVWARLQANRVRRNMPDVGEVISRFASGEPPFGLSSCFPYSHCDYYLPRPMTPPDELYNPSNRWKYGKLIKEQEFLHYSSFRKWCAGEDVLADIAGGAPRMYEQVIVPRVRVDRAGARPQLFHCGMVYFRQECGLYFLLEVLDDEWLGHIDLALRLLGECGIGGERSTGCGRFTHKLVEDIESQSEWRDIFSNGDDDYCLLSLYYPLESEWDMFQNSQQELAYGIVPRRGWVFSSAVGMQVKRQSCNMLGEGSVVPEKPVGGLAKVTPCGFPGHEVYRYGYAMSVPIHHSRGSEGDHE